MRFSKEKVGLAILMIIVILESSYLIATRPFAVSQSMRDSTSAPPSINSGTTPSMPDETALYMGQYQDPDLKLDLSPILFTRRALLNDPNSDNQKNNPQMGQIITHTGDFIEAGSFQNLKNPVKVATLPSTLALQQLIMFQQDEMALPYFFISVIDTHNVNRIIEINATTQTVTPIWENNLSHSKYTGFTGFARVTQAETQAGYLLLSIEACSNCKNRNPLNSTTIVLNLSTHQEKVIGLAQHFSFDLSNHKLRYDKLDLHNPQPSSSLDLP